MSDELSEEGVDDWTAFGKRIFDDWMQWFVRKIVNAPDDPVWLIDLPPYRYVLHVSHSNNVIDSTIREGQTSIKLIGNPPPVEWLETIGISRTQYWQQQLDAFIVMIHSVLDKSLLLVNGVLDLQIEPRECNYRTLIKSVGSNEPLRTALSNLKAEIDPLADYRNLYVHRGENRLIDSLFGVRVLESFGQTFSIPSVELDIDYLNTVEEVVKITSAELSRVEFAVQKLRKVLLAHYLDRLTALGGIQKASHEEIKGFIDWAESLRSGEEQKGTDSEPTDKKELVH